jgi:hypothetical protein
MQAREEVWWMWLSSSFPIAVRSGNYCSAICALQFCRHGTFDNATNAPMVEVTEAFAGKYSDQTMASLSSAKHGSLLAEAV